MKRLTSFIITLICCMSIFAKNPKTLVLTTTPIMHCESCETKIKNALKFEKGVKSIKTNVKEQRVTIEYDADKTSKEALIKALGKVKYTCQVISDQPTPAKKPVAKTDGTTGATATK